MERSATYGNRAAPVRRSVRQVPQGRHFINRRWSVAQPTETEPSPFGVAFRYAERGLRPPSPAGTTLY
ncbi:MAG: hypothetical protein LBR10_01380 [Prevotellaceae bacterium]|nr:hypothetical protein [Prevotellaceae bacterium]